MKKSRISEHQIISILKEAESGLKVNDIGRSHGINSATFYIWKSKYGGMEVLEIKRLRKIKPELSQYKRMLLQNSFMPHITQALADELVTEHTLSIHKACGSAHCQ